MIPGTAGIPKWVRIDRGGVKSHKSEPIVEFC